VNNAGNTLSISGPVSGSGGLTKIGSGALGLTGSNTYTGGTTISAGALVANETSSGWNPVAALGTGPVILGGGALTVNCVNGYGIVNSNITMAADSSFNVQNNQVNLYGPVTTTGGNHTLTKTGSGTLYLNSHSPQLGAIVVQAGALGADGGPNGYVQDSSNWGGSGVTVTIANGAEITTSGGPTLANRLVFAGGNGVFGLGAIDAGFNGTATFTGPITLTGTTGFGTAAGNVTIVGTISGSGGLTALGSNTLLLAGSNSYSGGTTVSSGILQLGGSGALPTNTALTVSGGTLDLNTYGSTVDSLNGGGTIGSIAGGAPLLTVGNAGGGGTFSGVISGPIALTKAGSGTVVLTGNNAYTGGTTVSAGTLQGNATSLQGSVTNNAAVVFNQTASGTYAGAMTGSGNLSKTGGGQLTVAGAGTFSASGGIAINQGTLIAPYGVSHGGAAVTVAGGAALQVGGEVNRAVSGNGTVTAASGLFIGDATQAGQFNQGGIAGVGGTLNVGSNAVVIRSADTAILGSQTNIGTGGSLATYNGAQLGNASSPDPTKVLTATGSAAINGNFVNNGVVNGPTGSGQFLTFTQFVQGAGDTTGNVEYAASYSPGNSPAAVSVQNVLLDPTSTLIMEFAGDTPGSQYDQLDISGLTTLNGTLDLNLLNDYSLDPSRTYEFISGPTTGHFSQVNGLPSGWQVSYAADSVNLVSSVPEPSTLVLLAVGAACLAGCGLRRRRKATEPTGLSRGDAPAPGILSFPPLYASQARRRAA
jgi:autotransporter-associated beta strand protein